MPNREAKTFRDAIEEIADQLCLAVDGNFNFHIHVDYEDASVKKLEMLVNFVLNAARRSLSAMHDINADLLRQKEQIDVARLQAEAANRAKSEFLANISHELRTPLTAIIGFSQVLSDTVTEREQRDAAQIISNNGAHLLQVINDLLDLAKVESGRLQVEKNDCELVPLLEDVISLMRVRAAAKGLFVQYEIHGAVPERIYTDALRLRQVLINLVGNGIKFTEQGGVRIVVRSLPPPLDIIQFDVVDTGMGIPTNVLPTLFQPFTQGDSSMSRRHGGTGLGLMISRRFANLLGGEVTIAESRHGVGTTFRLVIRANVHAALPGAPAEIRRCIDDAEPAQATALDGIHVLLAEDGPDNRRLIAHLLRKAGARVETVENGRAACDAILTNPHRRPFHAVLMDMQMPVMDGYAATRALRRAGCTLPIIALTAHAMPGDRERCIEAGCTNYTSKPIDRASLVQLIHDVTCLQLAPSPP